MSGGRAKVPTHEENLLMSAVVSFVVPPLENRVVASGFFGPDSYGSSPVKSASAPPKENGTSEGRGRVGGRVPPTQGGRVPPALPGTQGGALPKLSQDKISQDNFSQVESKSTKEDAPSPLKNSENESLESGGDGCIAAEGAASATASRSLIRDGRKQGYGTHKNVMLTPEGYQLVTQGMGIPEAYINHFSEKLQSHGYQYPDHAAALSAWWAEEKNKLFWKHASGSPPSEAVSSAESSFDVDDFFELALKKSFGANA